MNLSEITKTQEVAAHKMIGDLAVHMAYEVYEECASRYNNWYKMHPDAKEFVGRCAPTLVEEARRTLAALCGDEKLSVEERDEIHEALLMDAAIPGVESRGKFKKIVI